MILWIPGAQGLVGRALVEAVDVPCLATGHGEVDIGDLGAVRAFVKKNSGITHIVNCAAFSLVDLSETHREEAFRANAIGPENLGRVAMETNAHLIHISTDYVFPGDLHRPLKETDRVAPCNYYGETKLEGEKRLICVHPKACILRTSWVFGQGGKNFVAKLLQMFQEKEEVLLTDDQWGRPTYAPDLAAAILQLCDRSGFFQFANGGVTTKYAFGCAMRKFAEELGIPLAVKRIIPVPGTTFSSSCNRPIYTAFDTTKIERELNLSIRPWQKALCEFLNLY